MFEIFKSNGALWWRLRLSAGGRVIALSESSFKKRSAAIADIEKLRKLASGAQIVEVIE